jgi:hypothetical protein
MGIVVSCDLPTAIEPRQRRHVMATKRMLVQYWRLDRAILKLTLFALRPCPGTCCEFVGAVNSSLRNQRDLNRRLTGRKSPRLGHKQRVHAPARCDSAIAQVL